MRRVTVWGAAVVLLMGLAAGCGDDGSDDSSAQETSSAAPESSSEAPSSDEPSTDEPSNGDTSSTAPSSSPSSEPSENSTSKSPAGNGSVEDYCAASDEANQAQDVDALSAAVDGLADNLPKSATKKQAAGLSALQQVLADAKDMNDFVNMTQAEKQKNPDIADYMAYEEKTCGSAP